MNTITINDINYIQGEYILDNAPIYSKGCRSSRILVKNKNITDYIFARKIDDSWTQSDGKSAKFDKVFIKIDILKTIPELSNNNELVFDDNGIEKAPDIIHLDDNEKFQDNDGNILDIETRGIREDNKIYFRVKDVAKNFNMEQLQNNIIKEHTTYKQNVDYKYFTCEKKYIDKDNTSNKTNKIIIKKELFLTYEGILRVLFTTRNNKTTKFIKWASNILFTVQIGTIDLKNKLVSDIKGVSYESIQELFSINANALPCIYLTAFNTVDKLRDIMNIDNQYSNTDIIYKFGLTKSFEKRKNGHKSEYKKLENYIDMKLVYFTYIDPLYISQAELELNNLLNDYKLNWNNHNELIIIPNNMLKFIKTIYENIGMKYSGHTREFNRKIEELNKNIMVYENKLALKDMEYELQKEKYINELKDKDIQLLEYKIKLLEQN